MTGRMRTASRQQFQEAFTWENVLKLIFISGGLSGFPLAWE
jgi:hypothetical protein